MEYVAALVIPALWLIIYFKRRTKKIEIPPHEQIVEGSDQEREESERALRDLPVNIREHLAVDHDLIERFSTRHGYTSFYVEEIANQIRAKGSIAQVVFQPGAIAGVADSVIEQQGHYELWVPRTDAESVREILQNLANLPRP